MKVLNLAHKRKWYQNILAMLLIAVLAYIGRAESHVCYTVAAIATGGNFANAVAKIKNGKD